MSTLDHTLAPKPGGIRRLEVITGTGRRRRFSDDDKARIIEETFQVEGAMMTIHGYARVSDGQTLDAQVSALI